MTRKKKKAQFESFLTKYEQLGANISATCKSIGISRQTFYRWQAEDEEFATEIHNVEEALLDMSESYLIRHIKAENLTANIFHLKTKGKHRGWTESHQLDITSKGMGLNEINKEEWKRNHKAAVEVMNDELFNEDLSDESDTSK